jgi:HEAT repeat protein
MTPVTIQLFMFELDIRFEPGRKFNYKEVQKMKTKGNKTIKLAAIVLVAALLSSNIFAVNFLNNNITKTLKSDIPELMVKNLALGIETGNLGLRRSCIYFAGYYEIDELVEPLVKQLIKEPDSNTRILIALSLYKIGTKEAIKAIEELAKNDINPKVKKMGTAILNEFHDTQSYSTNLDITKK